MSILTHRCVVALRQLGRFLGVNRMLGKMLQAHRYEDRFQTLMLQTITSGDCVWDVGANVGYYARKFASAIGHEGRVIAFEPSPVNLAKLQSAVGALDNVMVVPLALGAQKGNVNFVQGGDVEGSTSRVATSESRQVKSHVTVQVMSGDELVTLQRVPSPSVLKIDAEGYELEILRGMKKLIQDVRLRAVFVEIHFAMLEDRGYKEGPRDIERMLLEAGYRCTWTDLSHMAALR